MDENLKEKIYRDKPRLKKEKKELDKEFNELRREVLNDRGAQPHFVSNPPLVADITLQDVADTKMQDQFINHLKKLQKHNKKLEKEKDKQEHPYGSDNSFIATSDDDDEGPTMEEYRNTMNYIKENARQIQSQQAEGARRMGTKPTTNDGSINMLKPRKKGGRRTRRRRRKKSTKRRRKSRRKKRRKSRRKRKR